MKLAANPGDVFTIPLDAERVGVGQVVGAYGSGDLFFAIYKQPFAKDSVDIDAALASGVALAGLALDLSIRDGEWTVIGTRGLPQSVFLPAYREGASQPGIYNVVDSTGARRRPATREEALFLPDRTMVSTNMFEKAYRALHGIGDWVDWYEILLPLEAHAEHHFFS